MKGWDLKTVGKDFLRGLFLSVLMTVIAVVFAWLLALGGMEVVTSLLGLAALSFTAAAALVSLIVILVWFVMTVIYGKLITFVDELV